MTTYKNLSVRDLKRMAKLTAKKKNLKLSQAQNLIARDAKFRDWNDALHQLSKSTLSINQLLAMSPHLCLIGDTYSGKTTTAKRLMREFADDNPKAHFKIVTPAKGINDWYETVANHLPFLSSLVSLEEPKYGPTPNEAAKMSLDDFVAESTEDVKDHCAILIHNLWKLKEGRIQPGSKDPIFPVWLVLDDVDMERLVRDHEIERENDNKSTILKVKEIIEQGGPLGIHVCIITQKFHFIPLVLRKYFRTRLIHNTSLKEALYLNEPKAADLQKFQYIPSFGNPPMADLFNYYQSGKYKEDKAQILITFFGQDALALKNYASQKQGLAVYFNLKNTQEPNKIFPNLTIHPHVIYDDINESTTQIRIETDSYTMDNLASDLIFGGGNAKLASEVKFDELNHRQVFPPDSMGISIDRKVFSTSNILRLEGRILQSHKIERM